MGVHRVVVKTTTILDSAFAVLMQFVGKDSGVLHVVVLTTTILDGADVVQET